MSLRKLILLLLCLGPMLLSAQRRSTRRPVRESWDRELINNYFRQNRPANIVDSAFYEAYRYLNYQLPADTANMNFSDFTKLVDDNRPEIELAWMRAFYDTVRVRSERFEREMTANREKWYLRRTLDTMDVASDDSLFSEILDIVSDNSVNYDSLVAITTPYTDTLVKAIRKNLADIKKMPVISQIRRMRNDTAIFYLVNINGDSLRFRLYDGSPRVIRTTIKDLAGNDEPALIRDIQRNSFRLLINDSPEIETDDMEKTRKLLLDRLEESRSHGLIRVNRPKPEDPHYWKLGGKIGLDATQMALHNWVKGGENTITLLSTLELYANYKRGAHSWENKGVFKYGAIRQGQKSMRTNEDKINITSNYGYRAFKKFYYSGQLEFKSQFAPIYEYNGNVKTRLASRFMAPATLTVGTGLEYKPDEHNSITLSPLTSKNTFVVSDTVSHKRYNVDEDRYVRSETGLYLKWVYKNKFWKNIEVNSVAEFFSNYFHKPQNVDVDWNLEMIFPINYHVRTTITTEMIYDDDQEIPVKDENGKQIGTTKGLQFKELLKLGIVFRF